MRLAVWLRALGGGTDAHLELTSGRRPRSVKGAEVVSLSDAILSDEDVLSLCQQAQFPHRPETINDTPVGWSFLTPEGPFSATAVMKGREVSLTIRSRLSAKEPKAHEHRRKTPRPPKPDPRASLSDMKAVRTGPIIESLTDRSRTGANSPTRHELKPKPVGFSEVKEVRTRDLRGEPASSAPPKSLGSRSDADERHRFTDERSHRIDPKTAHVIVAENPQTNAEERSPKESPSEREPPRERHDRDAAAPLERAEQSPPAEKGPPEARRSEPGARRALPPAPSESESAGSKEALEAIELRLAAERRGLAELKDVLETKGKELERLEALLLRREALARASPEPHRPDGPTGPSAARRPQHARQPLEPGQLDLAQAQKEPLLVELIREARRRDASDIHLSAGTDPQIRVGAGPLLGIHGPRSSSEEIDRIVGALTDAEQRAELEERGHVCLAVTVGTMARVRVNISRTSGGKKLAIRLHPVTAPSMASLELPAELGRATEPHQGLVLVTGPSGHGKTTTLAALVERVATERAGHIIMVEDPVEVIVPSKKAVVSQREVGRHARTFERALRGALRQDPDVIVVGELRDPTTVRIALAASETGHLVLGTMNTPSTRAAIDRLLGMFPTADQPQVRGTLAAGLRMVLNQRLVPRADGRGKVAAFEVLPGSTALSNLIREDKMVQLPSLIQRGRNAGIVRLIDSLGDLVKLGALKHEDARGYLQEPEELDELLGLGPRPPEPPPKPPSVPPPAPAEEDSQGGFFSKAGAFFSRNKGGGQ